MAPIKDDTVDALRDLVNKLESRVEQLEAKLQDSHGGPPARKTRSNSESVRMILMGPPGAGMSCILQTILWGMLMVFQRQGHAGTQN